MIFVSDFRLDRPSLNTSSSICVGYWIAYIRKSQILQINCLSTYPKWMYEMRWVSYVTHEDGDL